MKYDIRHKRFKSKEYFFKYRRIPNFIIFVGCSGIMNNLGIYESYNEFQRLKILNLFVFDTSLKANNIENFCFLNTKSFVSQYIILNIIELLGIKLFFLKKKEFFNLVINKLYNKLVK